MTINDILSIYNKVNEKLYTGSVSEAFFLIRKIIKEINDWNMSMEIDEYSSTYLQMLSHSIATKEFTRNEESRQIYNRLVFNLFMLVQKAKGTFLLRQSNLIEYEGQRLMINNPNMFLNDIIPSFEQIHTVLRQQYAAADQATDENDGDINYWNTATSIYQKTMSPLFAFVLLKSDMSSADLEQVKAIIADSTIALDARCIAVSALTMNVLRAFDSQKTNVLLSLVDSNENAIRQRVLVGIVLIISKYGYIIEYDEHLRNRITFICQNSELVSEIQSIVFQIVRTTETSKISKQINEEIMPEIMKMSPIIQDKLKNIDFDEDSEKIKPSIENMFDGIDFSDKIHDFTELQMSGSDVFAGTFAQMKGFPFFAFIENWILPFDSRNPYVRRLSNKKESIGKAISSNPLLCNSDKFSFSLNLLQMPDKQLDTVEFAIKEEREQLDEMIKDTDKSHNYTPQKIEANHYILDLYRFYSYFPRHTEIDNPLSRILNLCDSKIFEAMFPTPAERRKIGDAYFFYDHYLQAIDVYNRDIEAAGDSDIDYELYRNLAYSYQKEGRYQEAIDYYIVAEGLDKNSTWYLRRLAFCYRQIGDIPKAIDCYNEILEVAKDDFGVMFRLAVCYMEISQYDSALSILYKISYLKPDYRNIRSVLVSCLFYCGKLEQANELVTRYIEESAELEMKDLITAGHIALCLKMQDIAIERYQKAIAKAKDLKGFIDVFSADNNLLLHNGVDSNEVQLIIEKILIDKFR